MTLYSVKVTAVVSGQSNNPLINLFTFDAQDLGPDSELADGLADDFITEMVSAGSGLPLAVHTATVFTSVEVRCPFDDSVIAVRSINVAGQRVGTGMPRFVAWSFKQARGRGDMHQGNKRLGLVSEADTSGDAPAAGMVSVLDDVAQAMRLGYAITTSGGTFAVTPIIVKRIKYVTPEGNTAYRLPNGTDPYVWYPATSWTFDKISTQNSRKA